MKIFYFTGTGNSLQVAKMIGGDYYSIPQLLKQETIDVEDDQIGFVMPAYYQGTPRIIEEFLSKANLKSDYFFAVMTYGGNVGAGVKHFEVLAKKYGINLSYTAEVEMVSNYLTFFDIEEELAKKSDEAIERKIQHVSSEINDKKKNLVDKPLSHKLTTAGLQLYYKNKKRNADNKLYVTDDCTQCKVCEKVCNQNNITVTEKAVFHNKCDECLACVHLCPSNAIGHKSQKNMTRFKNPSVTLKEIIASNL
jgi:ferredoxin